MNKAKLIAILTTIIVIAIIVAVSNSNTEVKVIQQASQQVQSAQDESTASHHGGSNLENATIFNSLVGKPAPDFTLDTYEGDKITLSSLKGENVILFFNEGLMCYPACWNQITAFGKDSKLQSKAVILNITVDPKSDWKSAIDKMPELAQATVLFDSAREVSQKYGVLALPSSMHKGQFPGHSYVIINKEGIVKFAQDDAQMAVRNQELSQELDKI